MAFSWYGVKTIFRSRCIGKKSRSNKGTPSTVVEERVTIFRAKSFADAIKKAEKEARKYCDWVYTNPFGQKVQTKYLGACDAFIMNEAPGEGAEVYSHMNAVDPKISDTKIVDIALGDDRAFDKTRAFFLNREFSGDAPKN